MNPLEYSYKSVRWDEYAHTYTHGLETGEPATFSPGNPTS